MQSSISSYMCYLNKFYASLFSVVFFWWRHSSSCDKNEEKRSKGSPGGSGVPLRFPAITAIHVFTKLIRYNELSWPKQ